MIVWRIRGKIIRTLFHAVLSLLCTTIVHSHKYTVLTGVLGPAGLGLIDV